MITPCSWRSLLVCSVVLFGTLSHAEEMTNSLGMVFVDIPPGTFLMGACPWDSERNSRLIGEGSCKNPDPKVISNQAPQHYVRVPAFQIAKTEVTVGQFKVFTKSVGKAFKNQRFPDELDFYGFVNSNGDDRPALLVAWDDAKAFIAWLNKREKGVFHYRLPTEAEWEYACRAGGNERYCGSNDSNSVAWSATRDPQQPVGTKKPNAWGLYDMSGNAAEWVEDCWHTDYRGAPTDGSAWITECNPDHRVIRGGSYFNYYPEIATSRRPVVRKVRDIEVGFRLVRVVGNKN